MKSCSSVVFCITPLLVSCASPMGHLNEKISTFKKTHPEAFQILKRQNQPFRPMHVVAMGDPGKRPVVFVHGSPGDWSGWVEFMTDPKLIHRFHLLAVDRPGYGKSNPGKTERSLQRQAGDVDSALSLNTSGKTPIFVGHSYGGAVIAQWAADQMKFESRDAGLIFVASSVDPDLEETKWFQIPADWPVLKWVLPSALRVCNEEILALKSELQTLSTRWKFMSVKVITIHGTKDELVPIGNQNFIRNRLQQSEKRLVDEVVLKDMNHFIPWRKPETIRAAIEKMDDVLR